MREIRYYANPSTDVVRDAMTAGLIDCITTPRQGNRVPEGVPYCADNGAFSKGYPGDTEWFAWLSSLTPELCRFAVAPDVVGDAEATLAKSLPWLPKIRELGKPSAFVAQDGAETVGVPWDSFDVLFIGGTTEWKLGSHARALVREAKRRGKQAHMGRVNSFQRLRYAQAIGCDSADGTYLAYGPTVNLPTLLGWLHALEHPRLVVEATPLDSARCPDAARLPTTRRHHPGAT